jgi:thioredoxin 2
MELVCPHCGAVNRVPAERLSDQPKCGKCGAAVLPPHPVELTATSFDKFVTRNELPVLVDFWAPWCGPCRMIAPVVEEFGREQAGKIKVVSLNVDDNHNTASRFAIRSIPSMLFFKQGSLATQIVGACTKAQLTKAALEVLA